MDGQRSNVEGVPGRGKLPEMMVLGSFARKLKWGGENMHAYREGGIFGHRVYEV